MRIHVKPFSLKKTKVISMRKINEIQNDIKTLEQELMSTIKEQVGKIFENADKDTFYICYNADYENGLFMKTILVMPNHKVMVKKENVYIPIDEFSLTEITETELKTQLIGHFSLYIENIIHLEEENEYQDAVSPLGAESPIVRNKQEEGYRYLRTRKTK